MKKFVAFSLGAMLTMGFAACSDDDVVNSSIEQQLDGNLAYMSVRIMDPEDASTRADIETTDNDLEYGTSEERRINNIYFYFFNKSGKFLSKGSVQDTDAKKTEDGNGSDKNIEYKQVSVISVPNYNEENVPQVMVTLINVPDDFVMNVGDNISKLYEATATWGSIDASSGTGNFLMSTTSFSHPSTEAETARTYYYTTDLTDVKFAKTVLEAQSNDYVDIYVERVASKAYTDFSADVKTKSKTFYNIDEVMFRLGKFDVYTTGGKTETVTFYSKFLGWSLNGTNKKAYISKHIDNSWTDASFGFVWSDAARHRSYWGESYLFEGKSTETKYVKKDDTNVDKDGYYTKFDYSYVSANTAKDLAFGTNPQYCNPLTHPASYLNKSETYLPGALTHALLIARLTDKDGNKFSKNIVKYASNYYWEDALKEEFLTETFGTNLPVYLSKAADGTEGSENEYTAITANDIKYVSDTEMYNGEVQFNLTDDAAKKEWLDGTTKAKLGDENGEVTLTSGSKMNYINYQLEMQKGSQHMIYYKDGLMYYYALVQHINPGTNSSTDIPEGYYGMVRNHVYKLTIDGFQRTHNGKPDEDNPIIGPEGPNADPNTGEEKEDGTDDPIDPGHGVEDPNEPIIPNAEDDTNYYLGVNVNILSWRIVGQNVVL
jgi:hypothetical protein